MKPGRKLEEGWEAVTHIPGSQVRVPALPPTGFVPRRVLELPLPPVFPEPTSMRLWLVRGSRTGVEQAPANKGLGTVSQGQGGSLRPTRESHSQTFQGGTCSAFRPGRQHPPACPEAPSSLPPLGPLGPLGSGCLPLRLWAHLGTHLSPWPPALVMLQSPKLPFSGTCPPATQPSLQQGLLNALLAPGLVFQDIYVHSFTF